MKNDYVSGVSFDTDSIQSLVAHEMGHNTHIALALKRANLPYANGYLLAILPTTMKNIDKTNCTFVECENYIVYFKIDTPEEVKARFVKEYAEYYKREKELGHY